MHDALIEKLIKNKDKKLPGLKAQQKMMLHRDPAYNPHVNNARDSAVLIHLYPNALNQTEVIFIKRTQLPGSSHSGQIAFPGGKKEKEDHNLQETAIREAWEEVHILKKETKIIRELSPVYIPVSNFKIHPFLAFGEEKPAYLKPDPLEVELILNTEIERLFTNKTKETIEVFPQINMKVNAYKLDTHIIWGATAMILSELEALIAEI